MPEINAAAGGYTREEAQTVAALPLFDGVPDRLAALNALHPRAGAYAKGERILAEGEPCGRLGVLLAGGADIVKADENGDPVTVARLAPGEVFAEAFAFLGLALSVGVSAAEPCRVLWLDAAAVLKDGVLAARALRLSARKNVFLTERIGHLSKRTLREKILSYLRSARREAGKELFSVPFGRQGMADYLGCDRSALSYALSRLKREGVLDYHKNVFRLL